MKTMFIVLWESLENKNMMLYATYCESVHNSRNGFMPPTVDLQYSHSFYYATHKKYFFFIKLTGMQYPDSSPDLLQHDPDSGV